MRFSATLCTVPVFIAISCVPFATICHAQTGVFEGQSDIGTLLHPGQLRYDSERRSYSVSGSGDNMWFGADDFHFVWKKISGDVAVSADIAFVGDKGNNHRKAALLFRQTLEPGSVYVDVAVHGDGLTSLQYRDAVGADTHEVEAAVSAPRRVRIEKHGQEVYVFVGEGSKPLAYSGAALRSNINGDFYIGLGVCSHDKNITEEAIFSNVSIEPLTSVQRKEVLWSTVETVKIASTDRRVAYTTPNRIDATTWSKDGASLVLSQGGVTYTKTFGDETTPPRAETSAQSIAATSDGVSPDGKWRAFFALASTPGVEDTELRLVSVADHTTKLLARMNHVSGIPNSLSWSHDSARVAFISYAKLPEQ